MQIPILALKEQDVYIEKATSFIKGELIEDEFFHYASSMGVYRQRKLGTFMIRPRIFSGVVTYEQLIGISEIAKKYSNGEVHLTTRQDVQFHKMSIRDTVYAFRDFKNINLINIGAGGNSIRNIACPATSGVDTDEIFDVTPHAIAATEFVLSLDGIVALPRKYKIGFSNSNKDKGYALYSDLGFIAKIKNGKRGFQVYGAGGLGNKPTVALKLSGFINENEVFAHILGIKRLFEDYGDRENRSQARIRFIRYRLGDKDFKELYEKYVTRAAKDLENEHWKDSLLNRLSKTDAEVDIPHNIKNEEFSDKRIEVQKQIGTYSYLIQPLKGDLKSSDIDKLCDFIKDSDLKDFLEFRLSNDQSLLVRNLRLEDAQKLSGLFPETEGRTLLERSVACTGPKNCRIGLCDSQGLLESILELSKTYVESDRVKLPKLYISGCKNSCGWHWIGAIGFSGKKINTPEGVKEAFEIHLSGNTGIQNARLGITKGVLTKDQIIPFLNIVFDRFIELKEESFDLFLDKHLSFVEMQLEQQAGKVLKAGKVQKVLVS